MKIGFIGLGNMANDNPTICEYWVGLWECVARNNP